MKLFASVFVVAIGFACSAASAQNVKITPLGSRTGERCEPERARLFED